MKGYKHVEPQFADAFQRGTSFSIGTFSYYRALEGDRADELEGSVRYKVRSKHISPGSSHHDIAALRAMGIGTDGSGNVFLQDMESVAHFPDRYIFSCSVEPDEAYIQKGHCLFEIEDLEEFAARLSLARPALLRSPVVNAVRYEDRARNPFTEPSVCMDPFVKRTHFRAERELRIMWWGRIADPRLFLVSHSAAALVRKMSG